MKTLTKITFVIAFIFFSNICFGWNFTITSPNGASNCPTSYYYNGSYNYVDINITINGNTTSTYGWFARITQGGSSYSTPTSNGGQGNKTIQLSYSNICVNNDAQIEVFVNEDAGAWESQSKYFRLYSETGTLGCISGLAKSVAVDGESSTCLNPNNCSNMQGVFYIGSSCGLSSSSYAFKKYKVEWTKSGNFSNKSIIIQNNLCNGYDASIPNYQIESVNFFV